MFLFSILLITILASLLLIPFVTLPPTSRALQWYSLCCSSIYLTGLVTLLILAVIIFTVLLLINVFKRKVVFTVDSIISEDIFRTKKLKFLEIKGYIIRRSVLYVITNSDNKKRLAINLFSLDRTDNLIHNLEMRFTNLDF